MYDSKVVKRNIQYLIENLCENQEDFLSKTGINRTTIQRYKNEEKFSKLTIEKIITAFNLDVDAKSFCENLLPGIDDEKEQQEKLALNKTIENCLKSKFNDTEKVALSMQFITNLDEILMSNSSLEKLKNYLLLFKKINQ